MATFSSSPVEIRMQQFEPQTGLRHPALVILHGSGGAVSFWLNRLAPRLLDRSEEHTSELQSLRHLVCRLLLEKKKKNNSITLDNTTTCPITADDCSPRPS